MSAVQPASQYDLRIKPHRFSDLYASKLGWAVDTPDELAAVSASKATVRVALMGHFNAGKTFLINKLSGLRLASRTREHTEGLSIAISPFGGKQQIAWMDTAGLNSPVARLPHVVPEIDPYELQCDPERALERAREALSEEPREVKRLEDFHRNIAVEFADVYLFVLSQVSHSDMLEILLLLQKIQRERRNKSVFVVHNLRTWTREQLDRPRDDGLNYIDRVKKLFFLQREDLYSEATVDAEMNPVVQGVTPTGAPRSVRRPISRLFGVFGSQGQHQVPMLHVFMCDDAVEKEMNVCTVAHLRTAIQNVLPRDGGVQAAVEELVTREQTKYAQLTAVAAVRLVKRPVSEAGNKKEGWFMHAVDESGAPVDTKPVSSTVALPSYLTLGNDDLRYNVVQLSGSTMAAAGLVPWRRTLYAVQIELPGLTPARVKAIQDSMTWQNGSLRTDRHATLFIDFTTEEQAVPPRLVTKLQNQIPAEVVTFHELEPEMLEEGTRPAFSVRTHDTAQHPAGDDIFETVAVLQLLMDNAHGSDYLLPPGIWPMAVHAAFIVNAATGPALFSLFARGVWTNPRLAELAEPWRGRDKVFVRTVAVKIRTGPLYLSSMTRPLCTYNDGVLSIVVAGKC
jgi:hypothetical protein